jgi:predicted PurR-regulated permease PerM
MLETLRNLPPWLRLAFVFPLLFLNGLLLALLLDYLQPLVTFIIVAAILAFLLELAVELLIQRGMQRGLAITTVLLIALFSVVILGFILIPLIVDELAQFIDLAPEWIENTGKNLDKLSRSPLFERLSIDVNAILADASQQLANTLKSFGGQFLGIIAGTISSLINTLLVLVLTIFLLIGGDKFWQGVFSWLPSPWHEKLQEYTLQTFKDYFFVRLILAGISSLARWILLGIFGVPYAVLFGFGLGIAGFIPFLGAVLGLIGFIILCFKSLAIGIKFLVISFILDQINDNVLAPRLMGEAIGLNPVWLIISLFIGAKMGGILGLFLAVPVASIIKQIIDDLRSQNSPDLASVSVKNSIEPPRDMNS